MWKHSVSNAGKLWSRKSLRNYSVVKQAAPDISFSKMARDPEIEHHSKLANEWWSPSGKLKALHSMNSLRVPFVRDGLISAKKVDPSLYNTTEVLRGQTILDVGCGGGILSENLARLHGNVTGIDMSGELIKVAKQHLNDHSPGLRPFLNYNMEPIETHALNNLGKYDAVVLSEVIEHIEDKATFLTCCVDALKPGGSIFFTTLNKTVPMWLTGIILAEYVVNIVPPGTHHWDKLIGPKDLIKMLNGLNCSTVLVRGFVYEVWSNKWQWIPFDTFSYALHAIKNEK